MLGSKEKEEKLQTLATILLCLVFGNERAFHVETDEDEMLTYAVQASLRLHKEHQKNLEDAVVS